MFSKPRNNVVESDEGFSVEVLGRTGINYTEGSKTMFIDSEVLMGPSGMVVYKDSIKNWQKPYDNSELIDVKKRDEIMENIRQAFLFQGFEIEFE